MRTKLRRHSAQSTIDLQDNRVLSSVVSGPVTLDTLLFFKAQALAVFGGKADAMVIDYRSSVLGLDVDGLAELALSPIGLQIPVGLVVTNQSVDLFMRHAQRMALARRARRVFCATDQALVWASRQAPVPGGV
jgi:hypothetical protein